MNLFERLNDAQLRAVTHTGGPLMVLAGPGSGKTTVIVQRIIYLIDILKVSHSKILVITFTKDAATSMQKRFQALRDQAPVRFGTFHSVFLSFLTKYSNIEYKIINEQEKRRIISEIMESMGLFVNASVAQEDVMKIISAISMFRNTLDKDRSIRVLRAELQSNFDEIMGRYDHAKEQECSMDYDDMISRFLKVLEHDESIREKIRNDYPYILIDEFQDINPAQYSCVKLLTDRSSNVFVVGDDDQAIYGFRGTSPTTMQDYLREYEAEQILLNINYRCPRNILEASLKVIGANQNRFYKELQSSDMVNSEFAWVKNRNTLVGLTGNLKLEAFENRYQEYMYIAESCKALIDSGSEATVAILFRTNSYLDCLGTYLERHGIPFYTREPRKNIYQSFIAKDLGVFHKLSNEYQNSKLLRARVSDREMVDSIIRITNICGIKISREALVQNGRVNIDTLIEYYEKRNSANSKTIKELKVLRNKLMLISGLTLYASIKYIVHALGYKEYLRQKAIDDLQLEEWMEKLDFLMEDSKGRRDYFEWIEEVREVTIANIPRTNISNSKIYLMTIHGSKGLEFDHVIIPDCNENNIPHTRDTDEAGLEEERRIFYVAMTRAKKNLELLHLTGTEEHPRYPSRFIKDFIPR